jgi:hypothetical protein
VAINAVACFLLVREIRVSHGPMASAIVAMVLFLYYRFEGGLGTTLTENLGLSLGMISFAVLWRGGTGKRMSIVWLGLGLMTLSLCARAGAFFVLPALVLGGGWVFRGKSRCSLRFLTGALVAVTLGFCVNFALGKFLGDPNYPNTAFSNFSYTLYGLVAGGKGWGQVMIDHPGAREGAEIYALAFRTFLANPMGLVLGSLKMWQDYFFSGSHAFSFVKGDTYTGSIQMACYALSALGLAVCVRRSREPQYMLLAAAAVGHLASIPFAPPVDGGLRIYAATTPILAMLVAIGSAELGPIVKRLRSLSKVFGHSSTPGLDQAPITPCLAWPGTSVIFGLALAGFVIGGPLVVRLVGHAPEFNELSCADSEVAVYVRLTAGSFLRIVEDAKASENHHVIVPTIQVKDLRKTAGAVEIKNDMGRFLASSTMVNTYDLKTGRDVWLIAPTHLMPETPAIVGICGHDSDDVQSRKYGVFYTDSVTSVSVINSH